MLREYLSAELHAMRPRRFLEEDTNTSHCANTHSEVSCNCVDADPPNLVALGIILMVITAVLINFGNNIQVRRAERRWRPRRACLCIRESEERRVANGSAACEAPVS